MATALGLVAVGLYGTLSYSVQQRTRETGVRVAIGALKGDIVKLVFAQGGAGSRSGCCSASAAAWPSRRP